MIPIVFWPSLPPCENAMYADDTSCKRANMPLTIRRRVQGVRWGIARRIIIGWILTIPGCFALGYVLNILLTLVLGV